MSLVTHLVPSLSGAVAGDDVAIDGDEAHHAVVVRRLRVGERIVVTDGRGRSADATVAAVGKRELTVTLDEVREVAAPTPSITVIQAIPKGDRGELAVEMMTEIGVDRIVPWASARSLGGWKGERAIKQHARWTSTAREAAKQSRRVWFPGIGDLARTDQILGLIQAADLAVVLHEEASHSFASLPEPRGQVVLVVGPEGGLTDDEVDSCVGAGAVAVKLGTEVLRTSTAGVAAAAALLARTPRWS